MGAFDLAVGNLFGSNSFNMVIFVALDLAKPCRIHLCQLEPGARHFGHRSRLS